MPTYRANVSDKQQVDLENALNDSAIRIPWFDGKEMQTGVTKFVKANDLQQQRDVSATSPAMDNMKQFGHIIANHNDKPAVFETPGKA
jgi:hypothetical protein